MSITLQDMTDKYIACKKAIDESKTCETCKFSDLSVEQDPCAHCYNSMIGLPCNPTKWESKE